MIELQKILKKRPWGLSNDYLKGNLDGWIHCTTKLPLQNIKDNCSKEYFEGFWQAVETFKKLN